MRSKRQIRRAQRMPVIHGILCFALILVVAQFWLLTATMNAFLGGAGAVAVPALAASAACLLLNVGLLRYLS